MPQRQVKGRSRLNTERQANQLGTEGVFTCCLSIESDKPLLAHCRYEGFKFISVQYEPVILSAQLGVFRKSVHQGLKLQLAKKLS